MNNKNVLEVKNIDFSYGGLIVLQKVSFSLKAGEKVALIGPNGAGKSTLLSVLTGLLYPLKGEIFLFDKEISKLPPHHRVDLGLGRSFQINRLFFDLTLLENVLIALRNVEASSFQMIKPMMRLGQRLKKARELLESVGLWGKRYMDITSLSYGEQRQVEIVLALASEPKVLLLDEPSAGLTGEEAASLTEIIRDLMKDKAVLFAAHDLDLVYELADRIIVLYYGSIIVSGTAKEIEADPRVKEIYIGA